MSDHNEVDKMDQRRVDWGVAFCICMVLLVTIPVIVASRYSVYHADDFCHANDVGVFGGNIGALLIASLNFAKTKYLEWQGTYTSMFLQAFLSPLNGFGTIQLGIVMVLNVMLFIVSLFVFIKAVCEKLSIGNRNIWIVFSLCIVGILGFESWQEVFYWFSGAVSYTFPMSFCLSGIAAALQSKSLKGSLAAAVLMFLASGGTLEVAGTGCFVLLGICIVKYVQKSVQIKDYVVFGSAFAGALINTVAPGNYVRYDVIDSSGLHLGRAIITAVLEVVYRLEELLFNTPFVLVILIALILGAFIGKSGKAIDMKLVPFVIVMNVMVPIVTCFPVCLGDSGGGFPNRCQFIESVVLVIALVIIFGMIGWVFTEQLNLLLKKETLLVWGLFLIMMANVNPSWKLSQLISAKMWNELAYGSYKEYHDEVNRIYDFIANDNNEDVFVYKVPKDVEGFMEVVIATEDMTSWVNTAVARYYGKKSVQYVSNPLAVQREDGQKNIRISQETFGGKAGYLTIFNNNLKTQQVEELQVLQPLESNMIISFQEEDTGVLGVYLFSDNEGKNQIGGVDVDY